MQVQTRLGRTAHAHARTNPNESWQIWAKTDEFEFGQNRAKNGQIWAKNGQKRAENGRTKPVLAKQGETESFAETLFGFGHPWSDCAVHLFLIIKKKFRPFFFFQSLKGVF